MRTKEQVLLSIKDSGMVAVVRGETSDKAWRSWKNASRAGSRLSS